MKKLVLVLLISLLTGAVSAQQNTRHALKIPKETIDPLGNGSQPDLVGQKLTESIIGTTWYDLQSYGSMPMRMFAYPDGTIGASWMMGFETTGWSDRGTGYNYYDGSTWGDYPTGNVESIRTGWPCYAPLGPNGEIIVSHALPGTDWEILINRRTNKGQGDWTESSIAGPEPGQGIVWPAMVTSGDDHNTIHLLARTYNAGGTPYMDQNGALLYFRSTDGGDTWDIQNHFFDELGSNYFVNINADGYAWAQPHGNTIAFSVGFDATPGCIMKSTDNGDTWEFIEVYQCPFYPPLGGATAYFGAGDGSQALALDNNDNVHLAFGRMVYYYDDAGALYFITNTDGVIYWNETMPMLDSTIISSYTLENLISSGNLAGRVVDPGVSGLIAFPNYYCSLTSYPQMLIDENNRILLLWSGAAPNFTNGEKNYRHIYGNSSNDGGDSWNGIVDFNQDLVYIYSECVYPVIAPTLVNNQFHFYFVNDNSPGIYVWPDPPEQASPTENSITYMGLETSFLTGVKDNPVQGDNQLKVSQNFPNPFEKETFIQVSVEKPENISLVISDVAGRIFYSEDFGRITKDKFRIRFENNNLPAGIYYYTVTSDSGSYTGKMVVK
jgi:hypothetical protein